MMAGSRWTLEGGILRSPLLTSLGFVAGFSTRSLGSMGLGAAPEEARRNRDELARRLGFGAIARVKQVHGNAVVRADGPFDGPPEADALWTSAPGVLLAVGAADCVPVLIAHPDGAVGAAHAGWQGTSLGVAARLVGEMARAGADPTGMAAAIGPSIGPCCYTIDLDRAAVIRARLGEAADPLLLERDGGTAFDLWSANAAQLREAGVADVESSGICTRCGDAEVWSYRARERMGSGGGIGFIGRQA